MNVRSFQGAHFTRALFSLLWNPAAVTEMCRVHTAPDLCDQVRARPCTEDDLKSVKNGEMTIPEPKLSYGVPSYVNVASTSPMMNHMRQCICCQ
jgi:hypothetical protein